MSITARDLFFVLKVRDEASAALTNVSRDLLRVGSAAQAASKRAEAAGLRQRAANARAAAAAEMERLAILKKTGATKNQLAAVEASAAAYKNEARNIGLSAAALERQAQDLERAYVKRQRLAKALSDVGRASAIMGVAMVGAGALGAAALLSTAQAAQEYGRQVALTQTQIDGFKASQAQLSKIGIDTANNIAAPFEQMQSTLYDIFSSTNANLQQATVLLQAFSKAAVAGQVDVKDAAQSAMGIMNAFKIPFQDVNKVLDIQFQLVRKGVGTYAQFSSVIGRAVPSAVRYGQSLETLAGSLAFLTRNGLSPAMAAASAARAMDALDNPNAVANMKALGITVQDATGKFLPMTQVLEQLRAKILAMPAKDRVKALFEVFKGAGGTIQARRFLDQLILKPGQLESLEGFIKDMQGSTGQFGAAYSKMSKTVAAQSQLLHNRWETLKVTVGAALLPVLVKLVGAINAIFTAFEHLSPTTQKILIYFALFMSVMTAIGGIILIVAGGIATVAAAATALGLSLGAVVGILSGIGVVIAAIIAFGAAIVVAYKHSQRFRDVVGEIKKKIKEFIDIIVAFGKQVWNSFQTNVLPSLQKLWDIIQNKVLPALATFGKWIMDNVVSGAKQALAFLTPLIEKGFKYLGVILETYVIPKVNDMIKIWKKHKTEIKEAAKIIGIAVMAIIVIIGLLILIIGGALVGAFVLAVTIADKVTRAFDRITSAIKAVRSWLINTIPGAKSFGAAFHTIVSKAVDEMKKLPGQIKNVVTGAPQWLYSAGRSIIKGLINGIKDSLPSLGDTLKGVGSFIKNMKGPKAKDLVMLRPAGNWIMQGLKRGIKEKLGDLKKTLTDVSNTIHMSVQPSSPAFAGPPPGRRPPPGGAMTTGKTFNQTINVHTQEINPTKQAAQMGWELSNRMG